ncbi:hypothetical protein Peur_014571 [Populus x canadensis]
MIAFKGQSRAHPKKRRERRTHSKVLRANLGRERKLFAYTLLHTHEYKNITAHSSILILDIFDRCGGFFLPEPVELFVIYNQQEQRL